MNVIIAYNLKIFKIKNNGTTNCTEIMKDN